MNFLLKDNFCTIYKLKMHQLSNRLVENGFVPCDAQHPANIVITGVCAAFDADEERARRILEENQATGLPHYVIGCLVSVNPGAIPANIHKRYRTWQFDQLAADIIHEGSRSGFCDSLPTRFVSKEDYRIFDPSRHFIGISTGCGFHCSYCPHKIGAGGVVSRAKSDILIEVHEAISRGARILQLTAIDTASYGREKKESFPELLQDILQIIPQDVKIHISQFNPEGLDTEYLRGLFVTCCSHFAVADIQMPVQSASTRLLSILNRNYSISDLQNVLHSIKKNNPQIFLRTDIMVGVPTETYDDLDKTIEFVAACYDEAAVYGYEKKNGTPLADVPQTWEVADTKQRIQYVASHLKSRGIMVHSGGQDVDSLLENDRAKQKILQKSTSHEIKG